MHHRNQAQITHSNMFHHTPAREQTLNLSLKLALRMSRRFGYISEQALNQIGIKNILIVQSNGLQPDATTEKNRKNPKNQKNLKKTSQKILPWQGVQTRHNKENGAKDGSEGIKSHTAHKARAPRLQGCGAAAMAD